MDADVLLEVVDVKHENAIEQSETVNEVLRDLSSEEKPRVTALNKIDLLNDLADADTTLYPNAVAVSALKGVGLDTLCEKIAQVLAENMDTVQILVPFTKGELVELFHRRGYIEREEHRPEGTFIAGRITRSLRGYYAPYVIALRR